MFPIRKVSTKNVPKYMTSYKYFSLSRSIISTNIERLIEIMKQLAIQTSTDNGMIRMWLSAGPGNFGTTKDGCVTSLYMVIYKGNPFWRTGIKPNDFGPQPLETLQGLKEVTVSKRYPVKNAFLATTKSSNYLINTLGASEAKQKGGHYGIWVDPVTDEVYESSVRNVIFILKGYFLFHYIHIVIFSKLIFYCNLFFESSLFR